MTERVNVGGRHIGRGESVFIIAEAGVNHNGKIELAKQLVDAACKAKVDAVKFQTFKAKDLVTKKAGMAEYQKDHIKDVDSQYELIKNLELDYESFVELKEYCESKGILFLSTPHSPDAVSFLDPMMPAYKIGSGDLTNLPLLQQVAQYRKPIILSTGMASLDEVREAVEVIRNAGNHEIILLHCVTNYPADIRDVNLRAMNTLGKEFNLPVGFSDHTMGITVAIAAVSIGACVIEKHLTLNREMPGPDHKASLEPDELQEMVEAIRNVELAMGDGIKRPAAVELKLRNVTRKSLVAAAEIGKGIAISKEMISIKRPGQGIAPKHLTSIIGRRAKRKIREDEVLTWSMLE